MKYIVMVAALLYDEADGISKKIGLQACALSFDDDCSSLLCFGKNNVLSINYLNGEYKSKKEICKLSCKEENGSTYSDVKHISTLLDVLKELIGQDRPSMLYIRHMIPQPKLIGVLRYAKRNNIKIAYEIPTYPYYWEQMNVSRNKLKTAVKLWLETMYWPLIYRNIDRLCVVLCNSKTHFYKKMVSIKNGFSGEKQVYVERNTDNLEMIGVGTIYSYHGYDRIIEAMEKCGCKLSSGGEVFFHIVGKSDEIECLKEKVYDMGLDRNVIFHGVQYGQSLKKIYMKSNLGVGTMALSLRNADIDTAIKNVEYMSYYLPVVSSGRIFDIEIDSGLYVIVDEKLTINFDRLSDYVIKYYDDANIMTKVEKTLNAFTWKEILSEIKRSTLI